MSKKKCGLIPKTSSCSLEPHSHEKNEQYINGLIIDKCAQTKVDFGYLQL